MAFTVQHETECCLCGRTVAKNTQGYYFGQGQVAHHPSCPPKPRICEHCYLEIPVSRDSCPNCGL